MPASTESLTPDRVLCKTLVDQRGNPDLHPMAKDLAEGGGARLGAALLAQLELKLGWGKVRLLPEELEKGVCASVLEACQDFRWLVVDALGLNHQAGEDSAGAAESLNEPVDLLFLLRAAGHQLDSHAHFGVNQPH
jgi:hypothetical protein